MGQPSDTFAPGNLIGEKYRIGEVLGSGGMGTVYEATDIRIGRRVALKRLRYRYTGEETAVRRFHREAQAAGSIGHDNICEVTDIGTAADGSPYMVMPLLKGHTLGDLLDQDTRLPTMRAVDIVGQTLSALQAAHGANIVHRDLKPDNIFITKLGDRDDFVKLLDFGISKMLDQDTLSDLTKSGAVIGTPCYMAPEQAAAKRDLDHRVDVYAMGVILYESLLGQRPFPGESFSEVIVKVLGEPFPAPRTVDPSFPPALERVILTAMARDPSERYSSVDEMRLALDDAAAADTGLVSEYDDSSLTGAISSRPFTPNNLQETKTPAAIEIGTTGRGSQPPKNKSFRLYFGLFALLVIAVGVALATVGIRSKDSGEEVGPTSNTPPGDQITAPDVQQSPSPTAASDLAAPNVVLPAQQLPVPPEEVSNTAEARTVPKKRSDKRGGRPAEESRTRKESIVPAHDETEDAEKSAEQQKAEQQKSETIKGHFGTKFVTEY